MHLEHPAAAAAADAASGEAVAGGSSGVDGEPAKGSAGRPQLVELLLRTLPLTLTVLLLLLTRIPALPIKRALQRCVHVCGCQGVADWVLLLSCLVCVSALAATLGPVSSPLTTR